MAEACCVVRLYVQCTDKYDCVHKAFLFNAIALCTCLAGDAATGSFSHVTAYDTEPDHWGE
jgi:hypothetical protein